jgi:putative glutamine amidotransferase
MTTHDLAAMTARPTLAVVEVTRSRPDRPAYHAKVQTLNATVADAGRDGGWTVVRLAAADLETAALLDLTDSADAVVIVGGEDIDPRFYGGRSGYEGETTHFADADEGQIALVRRAAERGTPLLGICRGLQIINVALGGDIVQHIDDGIHRNPGVPIDQSLSTHDVTLLDSSDLAAALGDTTISVQSAHHQSVGRLGAGLLPVATAPDGVVEAVEHRSVPIIGVQWHPEAPGSPAAQLPLLLASLYSAAAVPAVAQAA